MIRRATIPAALVTLFALAALDVEARPATVSDFAICNQEATEKTGGGALPGPGGPPPAPPSLERGPGGRANTGASGGMASGTDSTGKLVAGAADPLDEGMAATHADDPVYRAAYRDCMTRRGITAKPSS
jgi:hypothetical protein